MFTPSSARTSAEPLRLVTLRLPCLATGTPAAAATIAAVVLTLNIVESPPPVPQVSSTSAWRERIGCHVPAHGARRAGDFVDRFALRGERGEQQADLVVGPLAPHDGVERGRHFLKGEVASAGDVAQYSSGLLQAYYVFCSGHTSVYRSSKPTRRNRIVIWLVILQYAPTERRFSLGVRRPTAELDGQKNNSRRRSRHRRCCGRVPGAR